MDGKPFQNLTVSLIMTVSYSLAAAWFYYAPSRGEPDVDVGFWRFLLYFLLLSFLFWIVAIPEKKPFPAYDLLMFTVLTVPAGVVASLLFLFGISEVGMQNTHGLEYALMALVPFSIAHKSVKGSVSTTPFVLAIIYWAVAYLWGNAIW